MDNVYYSLAGATLQQTNRYLRLMSSGEPSRISLRKRWISLNVIKLREKYIRALL